jgi:hypothetical protein
MRNTHLLLALCQAALVGSAVAVPAADATAHHACGGVGHQEQQQFKNAAPRHDAMLTFATPTGAYVSDVDVKITTDQGRVILQSFCAGPLMLLDVPAPGRYRIAATFDGHELHRTVNLGGTLATVLFTWQQHLDERGVVDQPGRDLDGVRTRQPRRG